MTPAASATAPAEGQTATAPRRRPHLGLTRRSGLYLLGGLLLLAAIPIIATVRILDQNALRNARARADAALRLELEGGVNRIGQLSDQALARADDLVRSPDVQHAYINADTEAIKRLARRYPGVVFNFAGRRIAGPQAPLSVTRTVWLTVNGERIGSLLPTVPLDQKLAARLLGTTPHGHSDRLLVVRDGRIVGTSQRFAFSGETIRLGEKRYRALLAAIPNGRGARLLAARPEAAIATTVRPYQRRVLYAALGSFAMLLLVSLLFARPILHALGDFRRLASQATTDSLTGLPNRRSFDEELALEWRRADRVGESLAVILADIDNFKQINDSFGHQAGDQVLAKIGEVLRGRVRQVDLAARYGGEEFAVLVPETDLAGARSLAQRLRRDLAKTKVTLPGGEELSVTASFGVSAKGELRRAEDLIASADHALYDAKRRGKNRVSSRRPAASPAV
jgi:diguanylate cyclase (GGDEF)-like protein